MKSYKITQIHQSYVTASSTDPEIINWFEAEVELIVSSYRITERSPHVIEVEGVKNPREVSWQIMEKFCKMGWEPFAVISRG